MFDENAFGILIEYFDLEDDEYAESEPDNFALRFKEFSRLAIDRFVEAPPASSARVTNLGHAIFAEFEQEARSANLIAWAKQARAQLSELGFSTVVVVTHGGRWLDEDASPWVTTSERGALKIAEVSLPSEPLRRALLASSAAHGLYDEGGWGPGVYVDTEAVEAMKLTPRNRPTSFSVAGAEFFRLGG